MRNLVVLQDSIHSLSLSGSEISSLAVNHALVRLYCLTKDGQFLCFDCSDALRLVYLSKFFFEDIRENWFSVEFVPTISTIVCVSSDGSIATVLEEQATGTLAAPEQIGVIDGGIAAAQWSPDFSRLLIITNNNTMLSMSCSWEVLNEVDLVAPVSPLSKVSISWKGDGELFAMASKDSSDELYHVRVYDSQLELRSEGRNVAEGTAAILKGVGSPVAFATNGSLIAIYQEKSGGIEQVCFLEKNGLRHGDFNLKKPTPREMYGKWEVDYLGYDLPSSLLVVNWKATKMDGSNRFIGCIQLYYRENYYWYLKQQWCEDSLVCLGFDKELASRLYMTQTVSEHTFPAVRVVDLSWAIAGSISRDSSVCVIDGSQLHFTPLGYHNVPPPMSMYQVNVEEWDKRFSGNCPKAVKFCSTKDTLLHDSNTDSAFAEWIGCTILDDNDSLLFICGDDRGKVQRGAFVSIKDVFSNKKVSDTVLKEDMRYRDLVLVNSGRELLVVLTGSTSNRQEVPRSSEANCICSSSLSREQYISDFKSDFLVCISLPISLVSSRVNTSESLACDLIAVSLLLNIPGAVYHTSPIFNSNEAGGIAVGIKNTSNADYEIWRISREDWDLAASNSASVIDFTNLCDNFIVNEPEICSSFTVIANASNSDNTDNFGSQPDFTVIAYSLKNRLYCGEVMLISGASSYIFNHSFSLLLFITLGTKPRLHFISLDALQKINPLQGEDQLLVEWSEPRPVERGARLVSSVENDSKLVIQLPRGNLEAFEPRLLILLMAQRLLLVNKYLECLLLLRRQRVDLNYLVDFDPELFLENLESLIKRSYKEGAVSGAGKGTGVDLLSLFITSLEPTDVTVTKYNIFESSTVANRERRREFIKTHQFEGDSKVSKVCEAAREIIKPLICEEKQAHLVNAMLCAYAKPKPPMLLDALLFIKESIIKVNAVPSSFAAAIGGGGGQSVSVQSAIKYLAFLADGQQLFDEALGACEFDMARAVARQCQMDPKAYLPLLERFESMGKGSEAGSLEDWIMRFHVNRHLKRSVKAADAYLSVLSSFHQLELATSANSKSIDSHLVTIEGALESVVGIIEKESLFYHIVPQLSRLDAAISLSGEAMISVSVKLMKSFISKVRQLYASKCLTEMKHSEAINAFLSMYPPAVGSAVDAALTQGNWALALGIAGRFQVANIGNTLGPDPIKIAQDIVNNFRQNQEMMSYSVSETGYDVAGASLSTSSSEKEREDIDRALLAAKLSLDYCKDPEAAVSILSVAHHWMAAIEVSAQFKRKDLTDEVFIAGRTAANEIISHLDSRCQLFESIVAELEVLWKNPAERLESVAASDPDLYAEMHEKDDDAGNELAANADTSSEFSVATKYSVLSLKSSTSSVRSGTSMVSILSNLSERSNTPSESTASQFSIQGIDHALLSRGKVSQYDSEKKKDKHHKRNSTEKRQKKMERSKMKVNSKDVLGLRKEANSCEELWNLANIRSLIQRAKDLAELLVVSGLIDDRILASRVQSSMDSFVKLLQTRMAPIAPLYPKEWLKKKAMESILRFQDPLQRLEDRVHRRYKSSAQLADSVHFLDDEIDELRNSKTWWQAAAEGVKMWFDTKLLGLQQHHGGH